MNKKPRLENLKPFKKGQSGNPAGRPKTLPSLDKLLIEVLGREDANGVTAAQRILQALQEKAYKGDSRAAEIILERAYGKPKQDLTLEAGISLNITRKVVK